MTGLSLKGKENAITVGGKVIGRKIARAKVAGKKGNNLNATITTVGKISVAKM
jgi:hypothetical protein